MEDCQHKTEDGTHQEDTEHSTRESCSCPSAPSHATLTCVSSRPGLTQTPSPCPVIGGSCDPLEGGNDAKGTAVANGLPLSTVSQCYMPREVPPRFRNQQEPKVLLKRGQPPLSCMLLGGGNGGDATPSPNASTADASDPTVDPVSLHSTSDASYTPSHANYTWGLGSGVQPPAQGMDKIIVDRSDMEKWPSVNESIRPEDSAAKSNSASWDSDLTSEERMSVGLRMDSSPLCEYIEATVEGGSSSQSENKESIKGINQSFISKVLHPAGNKEGTQGLNQNYSHPSWAAPMQDGPDEAASSRGPLTQTVSEESPPIPLSPLHQMLGKNKECIMADWMELKAGTNVVVDCKEGGVTCADVWDTGTETVGRKGEIAGGEGSSGDRTGISQVTWDKETVGSNEQAATEWTSDLAVGESREDVRKSSREGSDSLQGSTMFSTNTVTSRDDNKERVVGWGESDEESTDRKSSEEETLVHSPSRGQSLHQEEALQSVISRTNLDPRVLCNTGWGNTQIKQNVAWDLEVNSGNVDWNQEVHTGYNKEVSQNGGNAPHSSSKIQKRERLEGSQGHLGGGKGWGSDEQKWEERKMEKEDRWGKAQVSEGTCRREGVGRDQGGGSEWGQTAPLPKGGGLKEERDSDCKNQDEGLWGISEDAGHRSAAWGGNGGGSVNVNQHQGWGEKPSPSQISNNQIALKTQIQQLQSQTQQQMPGHPKSLQDSRSCPGGPDGQSKGSGWTCGPIPQMSSVVKPSGWEETSLQSISQKIEIDDGTSAWGDPSRYKSKNINLWDKNSSQTQQQSCQISLQQSSERHAEAPSKNSVPSTWRGSSGPPDQFVDNSSTAWGKSFDGPTVWGVSEEQEKGGVWANSHSHPAMSGSKSMQEGWGDEGSNASRHPSWEEEDAGTGVWGSRGSQSSMSTYNSGGWGQGQGARRHSTKSPLKGNSGDLWANPVSRQFSNMGIMDEVSNVGQERHDRRGMNDGEMRRGGRADGVFRSHNSKETTPGEGGPYLDKVGGHGMFGSSGISQLRGMHQAGVHPLNPSPGIRAQVPHQFLPPQVPGPMLKPVAPPSGGMFPPQLSPQHIAMLSGIHPHMQQFQLACQLILQQQQQQQQQQQFLNQRKFPPPPVRQQQDPQQLARIMAILQQQQGVGGPKLPSSPMGGHAPKHPDMPLHHLGVNAHKQPDMPLHASMGGPELHTKPVPAFTGFTGGSDLDYLSSPGGLKDGGGPQSRFKWMMDGNSLMPSLEPTLHNGPVKLGGGSLYSQYDVLGGNWNRTGSGKVDTSPANPTWPPEFQPGVPWKGVRGPELEPDPYMTPAGMLGSTVLSDTEHHLLQDNTAKYSELKSSWLPEPIGHSKSWRTNRNSSHLPSPPPCLTNQKQPWSAEGSRMSRAWRGGASGQESPFKSEWSDGGAGKSWLLLRNLTPQIDGSTLKTICLQHGPLMTFHLGLTQGSALIRYSSPHEAAKAQSALHMCVLGNTTILAEFMSEEEVIQYFTHSQTAGVTGSPEGSSSSDPSSRETERATGGGGDAEACAGWQGVGVTCGSGLALLSQWSNSTGEGVGKGVLGVVAPGYHGSSLWSMPQLEDSMAGLLPGNLLGGGTDNL
ncbi:trinucleotide repeat-containing gene 6B protein-like [Myxocyprinus asiaticus]|uniref:trinucleotide repeat-containing gene 6B protein-like n=1 Tax=Myxocyprinus asiaticus TaxID=70543 RepID=UPI0022232316|nr:trinucleotide repeat-containing gene 6B protein-like [Myxocyprinus asiaticus]